ncbi:MAG: DNA repair protein RecO [Clostridia bacterium]|nr:DNA repair protein RecO [Clostridia bacterium]
MEEKVCGLVIRETDYRENDKILTVITKELGKISICARGVRNSRSKNASAVRFMCYTEFVISGGRNNFYYMTQCALIQSFYKISEDVVKLSLATYLAQLAADIMPECSESGETLSLVLNTFYVLANTNKDLALVKAAFELRLMAQQGYMPQLECCNGCGEITSPMFFDISAGGLWCPACAAKGVKIEKNLLDALRYIAYCPLKQLFSFTVSENIAKDLYSCCEQYAVSVAGRPPKSLEYLKMFM